MKRKNIELMERVIGFLDGLAYLAQSPVGEALANVIETLESVLKEERERK